MKKIIYFGLVALVWASMVNASALYEADVRVDVTAETVTEAKKQAMAKAVRDALEEVVQSSSTENSLQFLEELNDNQLQNFVSGVMVLMEKSSDVRYLADLRVSIDEAVLRAYMKENNMPFVVNEEQDILIVPVLEKENGAIDMWSDENVWRQAFLDRGKLERGNLKIRVIDKNLGNITIIPMSRFYNMSEGEYKEVSSFNQVNTIYVLKLAVKEGVVWVKSFPEGKVSEIDVNGMKMSSIVEEVLPLLKGYGDKQKVVDEEIVTKRVYDVVYSYPQLAKWAALKKLLEANPQVSNISIVSMANGKVHFRFEFSGVIEKLQANLGVQGYQMKDEGEYYAIN